METTSVSAGTTSRFVYIFFGGLAVLMIAWLVFAGLSGKEWATIQLGQGETYTVRVADNLLEKAKGLSGTMPSDLGDAVGMLFVYDEAEYRTFWMKGMEYDLDVVWLRDGKIVKIDANVPAPEEGDEPISVTSKPLFVDAVLEMPAGMAQRLGYYVGHQLTIVLDVRP